MTQNAWLLKHFKSGKTITTLQAHRFGICRLSERIRELEKRHKINRTPKQVRSRFGRGKVRVVEYGMGK